MKKRSDFTDEWFLFMEELERAKDDLDFCKNEECFFRGHSSKEHKLLPGLFRGINNGEKEMPYDLWYSEYSSFYEFRARAKEVHQGNLSDWDILFYMQHHGCRTRLLDWTENFGVALYFALLGNRDKNFSPTIWMLNPYAWNEEHHDSRDLYSPEFLDDEDEDGENISYSDILIYDYDFWWDKPVAIYPIRRVDRLTTQGGYFTIHGNDIGPLEKVASKKSENLLRKIELPLAALKDAEDFLAMAGINDFTMFPDLDGLAQYLNRKYFN